MMTMADTLRYYSLFVVLPNKETLTVRKLSDCVKLDDIKAKLELLTGIHGNAIKLRYGDVPLSEENELKFGQNIKNGALVKLSVSEELLELYLAVCESNIQTLTHNCIVGDVGDPDADDGNDLVLASEDKRFFATLVACSRGNLQVTRALLNLDREDNWKKQCTRFGRTLAHVAAASDHTTILELLLDHGAPVQVEDCFHNTPVDVAVIHSAYTCERMIRQSFLKKKHLASQHRSNKPPTRTTGRTVCSSTTRKEIEGSEKITENSKIKLFRLLPQSAGISGRSLTSPRHISARSQATSPKRTTSAATISKSKADSTIHKSDPDVPGSAKNCVHKNCASRPPFMAFRSVAQEELRPVSVEYVPLDTFTYQERQKRPQSKSTDHIHARQDYPKAPCSSLNNSTEDLSVQNEKERLLERRNEIMKRYSRVKGTSCRAQSAKYYRTTYHLEMEMDSSIPKPRPATAGPRYREWKVWLLEKMQMDAENEKNKDADPERQEMNELAYKKWLARHKYPGDNAVEEDDEDDDDDDAENDKAYQDWLESKQKTFDEIARKRKELQRSNPDDENRFQRNRKMTIFELGSNSDQPVEPPKPDHYMRAFQTWKHTKKNYENWRKRKGLPPQQKNFSKAELHQSRDALLLQGMTYNEWLGLKARQDSNSKLHIHNL